MLGFHDMCHGSVLRLQKLPRIVGIAVEGFPGVRPSFVDSSHMDELASI